MNLFTIGFATSGCKRHSNLWSKYLQSYACSHTLSRGRHDRFYFWYLSAGRLRDLMSPLFHYFASSQVLWSSLPQLVAFLGLQLCCVAVLAKYWLHLWSSYQPEQKICTSQIYFTNLFEDLWSILNSLWPECCLPKCNQPCHIDAYRESWTPHRPLPANDINECF